MSRSKYLIIDQQNRHRCWWCGQLEIYIEYHDQEWGRPVVDDHRLFEKLCLEGFQAGLSWLTILKKRENFRSAFADFDVHRVARYSGRQVERLLKDAGIIRHRGKIEATINNAKRARELQLSHGSLAHFFWLYRPDKDPSFNPKRATSKQSEQMSRDLKRMGWRFVGPTTCYSFMQAMGIVNDHHPDCHVWSTVQSARLSLR